MQKSRRARIVGNGVVCVQLNNGFETWADARPVGEYLYNVVDDASSTP